MRIFFSVGEPSGDQHAARLIREIRSRRPDLEASGFGGPEMEAAGLHSHFRLTDLAVMGFFRVLPLIWKFYKLIRVGERVLREERPDAVVLVDFPGFNWWIARKASKLGIPVLYYLPPQLWAWGPWRIKRVRKTVDYVLCGLKFEQEWYEQRGVQAEYVGHPFFDEVQEHQLDQGFLEAFESKDQRNIGILPGSRGHEVAHNWPVIVKVISRVAQQHPDTRFLVACFSEAHRSKCEELLRDTSDLGCTLPIRFFVGKTPEVIELSDCCLMVSGSVSLEMLARATPAVVIYYFNWLPGHITKLLIQCKFGSLPNLMADREILPEFYPQGTGDTISLQVADKLCKWLDSNGELEQVETDLRHLRSDVMRTGAISKAAEAILSRIDPVSISRAA